jgi:hypothetical protein
MAADMPRMLDVMRVLMARPAASSLAELMRMPLDRRSMAVVWFKADVRKEFCAAMALKFVLMTDMDFFLQRLKLSGQEIQIEVLLLGDSVRVN